MVTLEPAAGAKFWGFSSFLSIFPLIFVLKMFKLLGNVGKHFTQPQNYRVFFTQLRILGDFFRKCDFFFNVFFYVF